MGEIKAVLAEKRSAEYRMTLPDEKSIAAELQRTRQMLEVREASREWRNDEQ